MYQSILIGKVMSLAGPSVSPEQSAVEALAKLNESGFPFLLVEGRSETGEGDAKWVLDKSTVLAALPKPYGERLEVRDLLSVEDVALCVGPETPLPSVLSSLIQRRISFALVVNASGNVIGKFSSRDALVVLQGLLADSKPMIQRGWLAQKLTVGRHHWRAL